mgnify:CR=1 FL=1
MTLKSDRIFHLEQGRNELAKLMPSENLFKLYYNWIALDEYQKTGPIRLAYDELRDNKPFLRAIEYDPDIAWQIDQTCEIEERLIPFNKSAFLTSIKQAELRYLLKHKAEIIQPMLVYEKTTKP